MCQKESWGAIFATTEAHSTQRDQPPRMHGPGLWMYERVVPRVNTSTMQRRAFSVVAPSIWNSLPSQIRLLPKSYRPLLYKLLKTDLFHCGWTGSASE